MKHYSDVKATDKEVVSKFYELLSLKAVCDYFGYKSNCQVQTILKRNNVNVKECKNKARLSRYKDYRMQGMTYAQIGEVEGVAKDTVANYCLLNDLGYSEEERQKIKSQIDFKPSINWQEKVNAKYKGYTIAVMQVTRRSDGESSLLLKCLECGEMINTTSCSFRTHSIGGYCPTCKRERERIEKEKRKEKERKNKEETRRLKALRKRKNIQIAFCSCKDCGALLPVGSNKKYCEACKQNRTREIYRQKDVKRRTRLRKVKHDKDITLHKLFERDKGICYLCGKTCDWNDHEYRGETFIAGMSYPTVEHVVPVSRGEADTWDNIKLACFLCNSKKGNRQVA